MTTVVNCKIHEFDKYIGRGSKWGNIFSHKSGTKAKFKVATRKEAIENYREWFLKQEHLIADLHELKNKRIGCWCVQTPINYIREDKQCHVEVLLEIIEKKL